MNNQSKSIPNTRFLSFKNPTYALLHNNSNNNNNFCGIVISTRMDKNMKKQTNTFAIRNWDFTRDTKFYSWWFPTEKKREWWKNTNSTFVFAIDKKPIYLL